MSRNDQKIIEEVPRLYKILPLRVLRRTADVLFDMIDPACFPRVDAVDRVIHRAGAISPGAVGNVEKPWYMHPCQDDNLLVLHGTRYIEIYTPDHGKVENFVVTATSVKKNDAVIHDGSAMLVWPRGVFHRVRSCEREGSLSVNLATHYDGFDIRTNFNIYDLDTETGYFRTIREGHLDQPGDA